MRIKIFYENGNTAILKIDSMKKFGEIADDFVRYEFIK